MQVCVLDIMLLFLLVTIYLFPTQLFKKNGQVTGLYLSFCCDCCSQSWCGPQGKRARLLDGEKDEG